MREISINYDAPPTVGDFLSSDEFLRLIVGPVGSGKSSGCCVEGGLILPLEMPPMADGVRRSRGCVIRNTYPELRDTTIKTWEEWVPEQFGHWRRTDRTFVIGQDEKGNWIPLLDDGTKVYCEVLFRALDKPQDIKKLLSLELTWAYINEWREVPKAVTDLIQTRVGRYPRKVDVPRYWTGVFGDSNAFDTDHPLYHDFCEPDEETGQMPEGRKIFIQPGGTDKNAENVEHLDRCFDPGEKEIEAAALKVGKSIHAPETRAQARKVQEARLAAGEHESPCRCYYVRMARKKRPSWIDCYIKNKFVFAVDGRPVYDNFNAKKHVQEFELPAKVGTIYNGQDYGLTPAAVFAHVMPDGQIRISHEFVATRMGAFNFGREMAILAKKEFGQASIQGWGDPAGMAGSSTDEEKTPISVVCGCGIPTVAAPTNEFTIRTDAVRLCLAMSTMSGEPEIIIHPRCKMLIKALSGGYCLRRKQVAGDEQFRDQPDKENPYSHVAEAMQYLVVGLGRDARVMDGGQEKPNRVQLTVRRSLGSASADRQSGGGGGGITVRRSIGR